jgi:hypothetical protein
VREGRRREKKRETRVASDNNKLNEG